MVVNLRRALLLSLIYLFCAGYSYAETNNLSYKYVINLSSSTSEQSLDLSEEKIKNFKIYQVQVKIKDKVWYKIRLGFFPDRESASLILKNIPDIYKGAWIDSVHHYDKKYLDQWRSREEPKQVNVIKIKPANNSALGPEQQTLLLDRGKTLFLDKKYQAAIPVFQKLYEAGSGSIKQEALELLGLSRERNGQLAHAVAEYKEFIKLYATDKEAINRVEQRLRALLTADKADKKALTKSAKNLSRPSSWLHYGALFQFYDKNEIDISSGSSIVSAEQLTTNLSLSGRLNDSDYKIKYQFDSLVGYDLDNETTDDERITALYIDMLTPERTYSLRAGRQRSSSGGVLGRFDGFDFGYRLSPGFQVKIITGYPVEINPTVNHYYDKEFTSIGFNIQPDIKYLDYNFYTIKQTADGLTDREEVGAEFRYMHPAFSLISLFDYSTQYSKTNYLVTILNWTYPDESSLNVYIDYRRSPFLTTTNALQGQAGVSTLSDLLQTLAEDEIEQLSSDRTAVSQSVTVRYSYPYNSVITYQGDFSINNLSGTIASGNVDATTGTDNEYSIAFSLLGKKWLTTTDNYLFRLRSSTLTTSDATIFDANATYRINTTWRIGPRLRYDTRSYDDGKYVTKNRVSLRTDYRLTKKVKFEMDISVENKYTEFPSNSPQSETDNIIHLGYVYTF